MIKNFFLVAGWGLSLGLAFILGRVTTPSAVIIEQPKAAEKVHRLAQVKDELQYSYYSELLKKPKNEAPDEPEAQPSADTKPPSSVTPAAPSRNRIAEALARVLGSETPEPVKSVIKESLPTNTGSPFAIQVASLPLRAPAEELVAQLQKKGHAAKLVQANIPGKGEYYRVRIHGFQSREEADKYRAEKGIEGITVGQ